MRIQVLDHGYIEFIEAWGHGRQVGHNPDGFGGVDYERGIIEAARQSTQGTFRSWDEPDETGRTDQKLLEFLYNNNHATPFEFAGCIIEVQAPIMVFREWHRHRTQSYNEMSARYTALPDLYYHLILPELFQRAQAAQQSANKQAGAAVLSKKIDVAELQDWLVVDEYLSGALESHYKRGLLIGVPKELARKKMPVDHYSRMRASANLRNWLAFMTLRADPKAQKEIRLYAEALGTILEEHFPRTWKQYVRSRTPMILKGTNKLTPDELNSLKPGPIMEFSGPPADSEGGET